MSLPLVEREPASASYSAVSSKSATGVHKKAPVGVERSTGADRIVVSDELPAL